MKYRLRHAMMTRSIEVPAGQVVWQVHRISATALVVSLVENPDDRTQADNIIVAASEVEPV